MTKVAIILSGCGLFDGSEIHESVCTLLALNKVGVEYQCMAPNINQTKVINHLTKQETDETRNVLVESARIARGDIIDIAKANVNDYDAAIYPGGFGAVSNNSTFALDGENCNVQKDVLTFGQAMAKAGKPQGFLCIAPTIISKMYGLGIRQTIGDDKETASKICAMGGDHIECPVKEAVVDKQHKVVSSPAYMLANGVAEVAAGADQLVKDVLALI